MNYNPASKFLHYCLGSVATIALFLLLFGCSDGSDGASGTSFGTLTGVVTDTFNNKVPNVTVTPSPAVDSLPGGRVSTAADGSFSMTLPNGTYTLTFANTAYVTQTLSVSVVATQTRANTNVVLVPSAAAAVTVTGPAAFPAAGSVTLTATPVPLDPALVGQPATFQWMDQRGNVIGTTAAVTVNRPTTAEFKANVAQMVAPLVAFEPNPLNTPDEAGEEGVHFKKVRIFQTIDRLQVVGVPMKAYEDAANPTYTVAVTIGGQTFNQTVVVGAGASGLPFVPNPGLRNVPIGQPLMLQGPDGSTVTGTATQTTWNFTLTPATGSALTALIDPTTRFPHFTPDVVGTYTVSETVSGQSMKIYAGQWVGVLKPAADGSDNPRGDLDPGCMPGCHTAVTQTKFTDWRKSGHSDIMVHGMAEGSHYSLANCGKCHSVGGTYLNADTSAGSFRDVAAAAGFTNATFLAKLVPSLDPAVTEKSKFFQGFPQVLQLSEVQCENCHGPNSNGDVHGLAKPDPVDANAARVSFSADVCAPCHGEPRRHGRFQEWRESGHGDVELAIAEGVAGVTAAVPFGTGPNANCAGCHTSQGYTQLITQLQGGNPLRTLSGASLTALASLRTNNVQPQTCVTCHTPHNAGRQPGLVGNVVILRGDFQAGGAFDGSTPLLPGGFQANGVGRGALCITCHNSRNGGLGTAGSATAPPVASLHEDGNRFFGFAWTGTISTVAPVSPVAYSAATLADGTFVTAFTSYGDPHGACQGDNLMGRNAYFFGTGLIGQRSKHSLLADACVTCHLEKVPADPAFGVSPTSSGTGTNHSFGIITDPTKTAEAQVNALCQQCHGTFEGTGVQKTFDSAYKSLLTELAIRTYLLKTGRTPAQDGFVIDTDQTRLETGSLNPPVAGDLKVTFIPGRSPQFIVNGTTFNLARATISTANVVTKEGWLTTVVLGATRADAVFTGITTAVASGTATSNLPPAGVVGVIPPSIVPAGTVLNSQGMDAILAKANWNASLVNGDSSRGVHNPSFAQDVISATLTALRSIQ